MADYFTYFSFIIKLPDHAKTYALDLARKPKEKPAHFPADLIPALEDWHFDTEADKAGIWLHSDSGGIDAVCLFVQHLLKKFNLSGAVTFEWSYDCSKPRIDAYGGGAAIITASEIKTMSTHQWLEENI